MSEPSFSEKTAVQAEPEVTVSSDASPSQTQTIDKEAQNATPVTTFPEGGLTGWLTVLGGFMVLFTTFGAVQSFGVYQDYYTRISLNEHPPSDVSWIGSLQVSLLFGLGLPAGRLFDEGYFHYLLAAGSIIYLVSLFMLSLVQPHHYYQNILAQGVGIGIGMGLLFIPSLSIASHYFRARRSLAMGIVLSGSSIGGVVYPIMQNHIFNGKGGFPWGVRAAGFVCLAMLIGANAMMRTRLPSRKQQVNPYTPKIWSYFSDVPYMFAVMGAFFVIWGLFFPFFYLQLYATKHGVPSSLAVYAISILNGSSLFGRTIPNYLSDRFGVLNVIIPMAYGSSILIFAMFGATNSAGMVVFAILYGFFSGGFISIVAPVMASFSKHVGEVGSRIGLFLTINAFAILTGSPIAGALLHPPEYVWKRPIIFAGVVVFAGSVMLTVSRFMAAKTRGTWRL